jgi:hypothetical protein
MLLTDKLEVRKHGDDRGLFAREPLAAGEPLVRFEGELVPTPSRFSLQVGMGLHLRGSPEQPEALLNHACEPNARFDFSTLTLVALRELATGEEVTFNYLTSEWDIAVPFQCRCGAAGCFGLIRGYRHLSIEDQRRLTPLAAPFLPRPETP